VSKINAYTSQSSENCLPYKSEGSCYPMRTLGSHWVHWSCSKRLPNWWQLMASSGHQSQECKPAVDFPPTLRDMYICYYCLVHDQPSAWTASQRTLHQALYPWKNKQLHFLEVKNRDRIILLSGSRLGDGCHAYNLLIWRQRSEGIMEPSSRGAFNLWSAGYSLLV